MQLNIHFINQDDYLKPIFTVESFLKNKCTTLLILFLFSKETFHQILMQRFNQEKLMEWMATVLFLLILSTYMIVCKLILLSSYRGFSVTRFDYTGA